ncbi:MAG: DUF4249 domain-containing protein [Prolixibacteraceae bacterium]
MKKYYWALLLLFFLSCTNEIIVDLPEQESYPVVFSTITPFTLPYPKTNNIQVFESNELSEEDTIVFDEAKIFVYENNVLLGNATYNNDSYSYPNNFTPQTGNNYSIRIISKAYDTLTSSTTIPQVVEIENLVVNPIAYIDMDDWAVSEVQITFHDPKNEVNYYEVCLSNKGINYDSRDFFELRTDNFSITSESYYPSVLNFDNNFPDFLLFKDDKFDGEKFVLNVYYSPPQSWKAGQNHISEQQLLVHLRNISREYYLHKTTLLHQIQNRSEDILYGTGEPVNVYSNIKNGRGVFAGFNSDIMQVTIKDTIY